MRDLLHLKKVTAAVQSNITPCTKAFRSPIRERAFKRFHAKVIAEQREATLGINSHAHQVASDARSMEDTARTVSHNAHRVKSMSDDMRALTARLDDQASALRTASAAFLAELKAA